MEVNGRFWGSLQWQLTQEWISLLLYQMAIGKN